MEEIVANPEDYQQAGPLQQVPKAIAMREIADLRLDEAGVYYAGKDTKAPRWARSPFSGLKRYQPRAVKTKAPKFRAFLCR